MNKLNKKAFTLIELIVVMAIIGILVLLAAPRFLGYTKDANVTAMKADAKMLSNIALQYNVENDAQWPTRIRDAGVDTILGTDDDVLSDAVAIADVNVTLQGLIGATTEVFPLDEYAINSEYKNLKEDISHYGIVTEAGKFQGEVFHLAGVEDRAGTVYFGTVLNNK